MDDYLLVLRSCGMHNLSPEEQQQHIEQWTVWMKDLTNQRKLKSVETLEDDGKVLNTPQLVTDGPFVEAKEVVGGFLIITAGSQEEAMEISKGCPILETDGTVEVRKIVPFQQILADEGMADKHLLKTV